MDGQLLFSCDGVIIAFWKRDLQRLVKKCAKIFWEIEDNISFFVIIEIRDALFQIKNHSSV